MKATTFISLILVLLSQGFLVNSARTFAPKLDVSAELGGKFVLPGLLGKASLCALRVKTPDAPLHAGILAEPFKPTRFILYRECSDGSNQDVGFRSKSPQGNEAFGAEAIHTFTKPGRSFLEVATCPAPWSTGRQDAQWCEDGSAIVIENVPVAVTYVRREIRQLSEQEQQDFFQAIRIMAGMTSLEGQQRYGPKFENYYEVVARHAASVMAMPCDLGHWGPALLTYHRTITRLFEGSIQAINPALTVPYWDMFIEGEMVDPAQSPLFSDKLFGNLSGDPHDNWNVKNGQFANWNVPQGEEALRLSKLTWGSLGPSNSLSPYGFFRRPDNMNRSPFITRIDHLGDSKMKFATRADWQSCKSSKELGLYKICLDLAGGAHSAPHMSVGGVAGMSTFDELESRLNCTGLSRAQCRTAFKLIQQLSHSARGNAIADGCLVCRRHCNTTLQDAAECACEFTEEERCSAENLLVRSMGKMQISPQSLVDAIGIPKELLKTVVQIGRLTIPTIDFQVGDYFDPATSASDPFFWVHHANFDRLLVSWRIAHPSKPWEESSFTFPSPSPKFYPDFLSDVNVLDQGESYYPGVFPPGNSNPLGICDGHGLWDYLAKGSFTGVFDGLPKTHSHTNLEILETVDTEIHSPAQADYVYYAYES